MSFADAFAGNLAMPSGAVSSMQFRGGAPVVADKSSFNDAFSNFVTNPWPGKRTNETSSVPDQVRPHREHYERSIMESDMLWSIHDWVKDKSGSIVASHATPFASLSYVNYLINNAGDESQQKWLVDNNSAGLNIGVPAKFVGVVRNEVRFKGIQGFRGLGFCCAHPNTAATQMIMDGRSDFRNQYAPYARMYVFYTVVLWRPLTNK